MNDNNAIWFCFVITTCFKILVSASPSFIVSTTERSLLNDGKEGFDNTKSPNAVPEVYEMKIFANVANRFARITITSKVRNLGDAPQETAFSVILPKQAYISGFVMEKGGKKYDAFVKEKHEAENLYGHAVAAGIAAGHVTAGARDSNRFFVNVNVEPQSKVVFHLIYEELLQRENGMYEIVMNIHPGQPVKNLDVVVNVNESRPLRFVRTSQIRSGNGIVGYNRNLDPHADVQVYGSSSAVIRFSPNIEQQKFFAQSLGMDVNHGLAAQFVVQYDVERDPFGGEVVLRDGYFVHFFAPDNLKPIPKHVIFVFDTSGSMEGRKIEQLKTALKSILNELRKDDFFHIAKFSSNTKVWDLENNENSVYYPTDDDDWRTGDTNENIGAKIFPAAYPADNSTKEKAAQVFDKLSALGGTNILDALKTALHLAGISKKSHNSLQPVIIFLTDGEATTGVTNNEEIIDKVTKLNDAVKATIFPLSFGDGANKTFLQRLALKNSGFSRHIYEASDSALQLQDFYKKISSPLLTNVKFVYAKEARNLTTTEFPTFYEGSELVVSGAFDSDKEFELPQVNAIGEKGPVDLVPKNVAQPVINLDRFWAYLTVKELLKEKELHPKNAQQLEKKALELSLKYSFVTPISSLVVVKPNLTNVVDLKAADDNLPEMPMITPSPPPPPEEESTTTTPMIATATTSTTTTMRSTTELSTSTPKKIIPVMRPFNKSEELKQNLPWLPNIMGNDDLIHTKWGTFKLGTNESITSDQYCPSTPFGGVGVCTLLHECTSAHHLFTNVYIFRQYFCSINNQYAGICCETKHNYHVESN